MIGGLCTGVAFLAEAGLLDGRRATTHWGVARNFQRLYPKVDWHPEVLITEDSGLFCSGGVYASVDLSLYLVEKLCGHQIAVECSKALLINMPRFYQAGYSILPISRPHADQKIRQVEEYLQAHFSKPVSIDELAQHAGHEPPQFPEAIQGGDRRHAGRVSADVPRRRGAADPGGEHDFGAAGRLGGRL